MNEQSPIQFALIFIPIWLIAVAAVVWLVIYQDGWRLLAKRYRSEQPASGKVWRWQYAQISWGYYRNILTLTANAEGLFMELPWFARLARPRLFIPWQDFHNAELTTYFFRRIVKVDVGARIVTMRLPPAVFEQSEGRKLIADQLSSAARTNQAETKAS